MARTRWLGAGLLVLAWTVGCERDQGEPGDGKSGSGATTAGASGGGGRDGAAGRAGAAGHGDSAAGRAGSAGIGEGGSGDEAGGASGAGGTDGAEVDACRELPVCDGDVVGVWHFVNECPATRNAGFDTLPLECEQPVVRDVLKGSLTVGSDGTLTIDGEQTETVTQTWTAECATASGTESTAESCAAREMPSQFYDSVTCSFAGETCTCVASNTSQVTNAPMPYAAADLCAHGDELRYTVRVADSGPGNAPAPDRTIVYGLRRAQ